ncbi:MAG: lysophospholipid acyltransferase family protein [Pseudomonadota bacterium]
MIREARARLFAVVFYLLTALFLIIGSPLLIAPRKWAMAGLATHARACLIAQRLVAGTRVDIRGRENLPDGPCLVVAKHQSAWETFALIPLLHDPAIVMKSELTRIPLYGWFCRKFEHILVARDRRAAALKSLVADAQNRAAAGRQVLIFAEGTRRAPGAPPAYKPGYLALYQGLDLPTVPLALNSGVYWPARSARSYPGTIVVDIAPPIAPGLDRRAAADAIVTAIETRATALLPPDHPAASPARHARTEGGPDDSGLGIAHTPEPIARAKQEL